MTNEIVQAQDQASSLVKSLERSFKDALPKHVMKEQFARALLTEFRRTPKLLKCSQTSVGSSVLLFAQLGLPVGVNGSGWIIPFKEEATPVIGYQGIIDLCYRSNMIKSIMADVVYENDSFKTEQGLHPVLEHKKLLRGERGTMYAAYAVAWIEGATVPAFEVMTLDEIMDVKQSSYAAKTDKSPWNGKFESEMWKKTVLRRLCKKLPKSTELVAALDFEAREEERLKDVDARIVEDDLLSDGRHTRRKERPTTPPQREAAAQTEQTAATEPTDECNSYSHIAAYASTHASMIDKAIAKTRDLVDDFPPNLKTFADLTNYYMADEERCAQIRAQFEIIRASQKGTSS